MARRFLRGQNVAFGLSVFLFIFMFLPTFLILLAVVAFFLLAYPRLRKSYGLDREQGVQPRQVEVVEN
ncbi:hypothetical protein N7488_008688 [Penicillium malachiteum]|nr:hypothetical protein N7488_008688 [Penicillium malachiteum]